MSDILQRSARTESNRERTRGDFKRVRGSGKGNRGGLFDHLHATAFQHTGLGRTILGSADSVRKITREDLEKYIKTHYTAPEWL